MQTDKVQLYLEIVPLWFVLGAPVVGLLAFFMIPARIRLDVCLVWAMVWLTLGELVQLGVVHAAAKATGFAVYLVVFLAAITDPYPKRRTPPMAWLYVFIGIQAFIYIWTVVNLPLALVIRAQWLFLVMAAIAVANTIVDERSLKRIWRALSIGFALALLLPASELFLNPASAFLGTGRFNPYDSNPNHIGVVFAFTPMFALYAAMHTTKRIRRWAWLGIAALAAGCGLITASRSTMVVMMGVCAPLAMVYFKRPAMVVVGGVVLLGAIILATSFAENVNFGRYTLQEVLESERVQSLGDHPYWPIIAERPLFGLLGTQGESFLRSESDIIGHAHNAYWELLYFGGFSYGIPWFLIIGYTFFCVFIAWRERRLIQADPLLVQLLMACMVMIYAHGFVNHALHYPTTTISFVHVMLSVFFIGLAAPLSQGRPALGWERDEDLESWDDYDDEYDHDSQYGHGYDYDYDYDYDRDPQPA